MTNQDIFRDEWWIDISFQLLYFGLLDASNFEGSLLRTDIPNGIWLRGQLNRIYLEHAPTQRKTIKIRVLQPDYVLSQCFTLMLEVMVRRSEVTRFFTFPQPFGSVASPVTAPASTAQVLSSAAPAAGVPGPSSCGGDEVFGGSGAAGGTSGSGGGGDFGGSGGSGDDDVPGGSGGS